MTKLYLVAALCANMACLSLAEGSPSGHDRPGTPSAARPSNQFSSAPRDPFWPVGYWPAPEPEPEGPTADVVAVRKPKPQARPQWPALRLKGVTRRTDGTCFAILADVGIVEAGDAITLVRNSVVYSWRINEVTDAAVTFTKLEARPAGGRAGKEEPE